MAEQTNLTGQARCRFLTCKEMFYKDIVGDGVPHSGSGNFWCSMTQTIQGPDGKLVEPHECNRERTCYQGV